MPNRRNRLADQRIVDEAVRIARRAVVSPDIIGATGPQGPQGPAGIGATGATGAQGPVGATGPQGPQGSQGDPGIAGGQGATGATGPQGPQGVMGPIGPEGAAGAQGATGATGPQGPQGPQGDPGIAGGQGATGATGPQGPQGVMGPIGPEGDTGPQGPQGATGATGPQGLQGPQGDPGIAGGQGATGATGPQGPQGVMGPQGLEGDTGQTGPQGEAAGLPFTFSTSVTISDPGSGTVRFNNATLASVTQVVIDDLTRLGGSVRAFLATIDDSTSAVKGYLLFRSNTNGDASWALFQVSSVSQPTGYSNVAVTFVAGGSTFSNGENLVVTPLRTGDQGATGPQGPQGPQGDPGIAGGQGATGATGPPGPQGVMGPIGPEGAAGAQGATGATGPQGSQGDPGPQGIQGLQGPPGATGPQGPAGAAGDQGPTGPAAGVLYSFSTTTAIGDPGVARMRSNNATAASVTRLLFDDQQLNGINVRAYLTTFGGSSGSPKGYITLANADHTKYQVYAVDSVATPSGYVDVTVTHVASGGGQFADTEQVGVLFSRNGDAGATGAQGPTGPAGSGIGSTGFQGSDTSTTVSASLQDLPDLELAVSAFAVVYFRFFVRFQTAATTTGIVLGLTVPAGSTLMSKLTARQGGAGTDAYYETDSNSLTPSYGQPSVPAANTSYTATVEGTLLVGATAGNLALKYRSEVNGSQVTLERGSAGFCIPL